MFVLLFVPTADPAQGLSGKLSLPGPRPPARDDAHSDLWPRHPAQQQEAELQDVQESRAEERGRRREEIIPQAWSQEWSKVQQLLHSAKVTLVDPYI